MDSIVSKVYLINSYIAIVIRVYRIVTEFFGGRDSTLKSHSDLNILGYILTEVC